MEGTLGKTLLDKPAVAPKLPETDFFNGLLASDAAAQVAAGLARTREVYTLKRTVGDASVVPGSPAERILRMAEATDADIILLGGCELTYGEPFALGPVAEAVMQHARQPVLARNPFHVPALEGRAEACNGLGRGERATRCRQRVDVLRHQTWI